MPRSLAALQLLVLDEGDHLLADGFAIRLISIRQALPEVQQRVCCSATWPPALVALAQQMLVAPEAVLVDRDQVPREVEQWIYEVHGGNKQFLLQKLLRKKQDWDKVMVFTRSKMGADRIARALKRVKVNAASVHGGCRQNQRQRTMASFDAGDIRVLVTTDLAGRGLDFSQVKVVVNFNLPANPSQYLHRVGSTGRAGFPGTAISFVDDREQDELAGHRILTGCIHSRASRASVCSARDHHRPRRGKASCSGGKEKSAGRFKPPANKRNKK